MKLSERTMLLKIMKAFHYTPPTRLCPNSREVEVAGPVGASRP